MGKKIKTVTLSRSMYMELKKMDHSTMEDYISRIYEQGRAAGSKEAADPFDLEKAMDLITHTRGVGPSKLQLIREALVAAGAKEAGHDGE